MGVGGQEPGAGRKKPSLRTGPRLLSPDPSLKLTVGFGGLTRAGG